MQPLDVCRKEPKSVHLSQISRKKGGKKQISSYLCIKNRVAVLLSTIRLRSREEGVMLFRATFNPLKKAWRP